MSQQPITVEAFASACGLTTPAVLSHADELKRQGAWLDESGALLLPYGSRRHYNLGSTKLDGDGKRYYTILKATSMKCYVDAQVIDVLPEEFDAMIRALVDAGLLVSSGVANDHGANGYVCTPGATALLEEKAQKAAKRLMEILGTAATLGSLAAQVATL